MKGIIGKKLGMTQIYDDNGAIVPVTVIQAGPCKITALRTAARDGYSAVQLGFGARKSKNIAKAQIGQFAKAGITAELPATLKEFRVETDSKLELGATITASDIFTRNGYVDVTATSKGRGLAGVVKRYGFAGGRASHGGDWTRRTGSIGMCEHPGNVYKGRKMPGHMGNVQVTTQNLKVVSVRAEESVILVKGAVAGPVGGYVYISHAIKK